MIRVFIQQYAYLLAKTFAPQLHRRHIYRDARHRKPLLPPRGLILQYTRYGPLPDLYDHAGFFEYGNKVARRYQPTVGVVPANQCFETDNACAVGLHPGLIVQHERIVLQCAAHFTFEAQCLRHAHIHLRLIKHVLLGRCFGLLQCRLGVPEKRIDIRAIVGIQRNAGHCRQIEFVTIHLKRQLERADDGVLYRQQQLRFIAAIAKHQRKMVARYAPHIVRFRPRGAQALRKLAYRLIAGLASERFIHKPKAAYIQQ